MGFASPASNHFGGHSAGNGMLPKRIHIDQVLGNIGELVHNGCRQYQFCQLLCSNYCKSVGDCLDFGFEGVEWTVYNCQGYGFNFEGSYGEMGKDFIGAHHLVPISLFKGDLCVSRKKTEKRDYPFGARGLELNITSSRSLC